MRPPSNIGFATRVAALYAAIFAMIGVQLPFLPIWLKAKGLDAQMIGVVLAIPMVVRVFAIPLASRLADRRDALRAAIVIAACASVIGYGLVGLAEGVRAILVAYALASIVFTPMMPLSDTYALRGLGERRLAYGPVRLWGSAAFILGTYVAGFASDIMPARELIWLVTAATALIAIAALVLSPATTTTAQPSEPGTARPSLLRDPAFIAVLASASMIQASHAVFYSFASLEWRAAQLDGSTIAGLWAIGVIAEIVLFALSGRLPPMIQPTMLLMIGAAGAAFRWAAMALDPPAIVLPFLQTLHALSFGASYLGALWFVAKRAAPGQAATAQGHLAVASGVVMAVAMGLSGLLYAAFGAGAYAAMALAAVAGGGCAAIAHRAGRYPPR
jgi:MFS transporter, PPP family, 3-phenylpropionic acid transporter